MAVFFAFILGGGLYGLLEVAWRGFTHWTMLILGGACTAAGYVISGVNITFFKKLCLCTAIITTLEFLTGIVVNIMLNWHVWDYSGQPFNILGQICPQFVFLWGLLSAGGLGLCQFLRQLPQRLRRRLPPGRRQA